MWQGYSGKLTINDIPLRNISSSVLHEKIAFYLTDDELFSGTLIENITLGQSNVDYKELQKIIELVGLSDFVSSRKEGYDTVLDTQGKKLSFNVVQKILLTRCLYKRPPLLLLEDGWMQIDDVSKNKIIDYLTSKNNLFTMIAISNDKNLIAKCDKAYLMDRGKINSSANVFTG